MPTYFERRRLRKQVKHVLYEARHTGHMREDVAPAEELAALMAARADLEAAWRARAWERLAPAMQAVQARAQALWPERRWPRLRENFEILVVAVAVAMGFRTHFVQPFKIPTGSMQPTLYGIAMGPPAAWSVFNHPPLSLVRWALFGERAVTIRMPVSGVVKVLGVAPAQALFLGGDGRGGIRSRALETNYEALYITIGETGLRLPIPALFERHFSDGEFLQRGAVLARGAQRSGDHIFVNKVAYNLFSPRRGQVVVFDTVHIDFPGIRTDNFYIKRLAGLPHERISIRERHLVVNGEPVTEPWPFRRMVEDPGYAGYTTTPVTPGPDGPHVALGRPGDVLALGAGEYLMLGDNTRHSLDGRYFGAVQARDLLGPAFMVYWPLGPRWGRIQ
ncbi:MAG: signal peptidase I [Candidatus Marinimicrobia bacterium]|nr:signal peptidase I [Candidatus Neomarinimicrobiota bacterium]